MASTMMTPPERRPATFWRKARVECDVIGALLMRELHTRYGRENIGYLWLILEPMLLGSAVALLHARSGAKYGSDMAPIPLALMGYANFMTLRSVINRSEGALEANLPLFHHKNVSIFDVLVSRAILEASGTMMAQVILMGLAISLGAAHLPYRPLALMAGILSMLVLSFGFSMIVCAVTHDNRSAGRIVHPITYLLLPTSGAFFTLQSIPQPFQTYISYVPFAHVFEIIRYGAFQSAVPDYIDLQYLFGWIMGTWFFGLLLIANVRKHIQMV